ncbi:uncharacterized protein H6S33_009976 [Morchella sextelata]|uniref:uncharacterized protein n=1 Tax=Morchella sextelata TaxID=1174677 RepID=UPI001D0561FB|nr:uncharacterized protein H6S33_009976 [Morchella sextelata]KAH0611924.1 hypothetical protein H6S33_009976 [Morchella sextelata]
MNILIDNKVSTLNASDPRIRSRTDKSLSASSPTTEVATPSPELNSNVEGLGLSKPAKEDKYPKFQVKPWHSIVPSSDNSTSIPEEVDSTGV